MKLIFERGAPGRGCDLVPPCTLPLPDLGGFARTASPRLPQVSETELSRHYTALAGRTRGVNGGFYPLGSCTMKYNPKAGEAAAALPGFTGVHPLQPAHTVQGCLETLAQAERYLCEITGMDAMNFQPAAGAHGEFTGLLLIKAYHAARGDGPRTKMLVPDSAHGTNPASAAMAGFEVVNIPSLPDGCVDLDALRAAAGPDTAGLMLTNPNTVGLFDKNILAITEIVHAAGGLCYYDGANLNAVMGVARPGDMGFDVVHLNLHKTFAVGGGEGLVEVEMHHVEAHIPGARPECLPEGWRWHRESHSVGDVKAFHGNFLVVVRALAYILTLGREGIPQAARNAVLNANYLMSRLRGHYDLAYDRPCMHEFVLTLEPLKQQTGVSALDIAKALLDRGIHPPTMYFPLIVHEALMIEPTETEPRETLDEAADALLEILAEARRAPADLHAMPRTTPVRRPDEVAAARKPVLRYCWEGPAT